MDVAVLTWAYSGEPCWVGGHSQPREVTDSERAHFPLARTALVDRWGVTVFVREPIEEVRAALETARGESGT